jgi:hypothetical protein
VLLLPPRKRGSTSFHERVNPAFAGMTRMGRFSTGHLDEQAGCNVGLGRIVFEASVVGRWLPATPG